MLRWLKKRPAVKKEEKLQLWQDASGHRLPYVFRPSPKPDRPLLLILHGNGFHERPSQYKSDDYNILIPLDRYGFKGQGCWYLGENGDFFVQKMLLDLVRHIEAQYGLEKRYIWGSSMGGYASILTGLLLEAHAVFAHIAQTNLRNSAWYKEHKKRIDFIFGPDNGKHPLRDLVETVKAHQGLFPLFLLSFNRYDYPNYNAEHMTPLVNCLEEKNLNYLLLIHPQRGHRINVKSADLVNYFSVYDKEITSYREEQAGSLD